MSVRGSAFPRLSRPPARRHVDARRRLTPQVVDALVDQDLAAAQDDDGITQLLRLCEVVRTHEDSPSGHRFLSSRRVSAAASGSRPTVGSSSSRSDGRLMIGAGDEQTALKPAGKGGKRAIEVSRAARSRRRWPSRRRHVEIPHERQVLAYREIGVHSGALRDDADPALGLDDTSSRARRPRGC